MALNHDTILLLKFLCVFAITLSINAYKEIKSYRLIQYENGDQLFGSQYSSLNYIGSYYKSDSLRKIAIAPLSEIKDVSEIERIVKGNANAVLFVIPNNNSSLEELKTLLNQAQVMLSEKTLYLPIYFCYENEEILSVIKSLKEEYEQSGEVNEYAEQPEKKGLFNYLGVNQNLLHFSLSVNEPKKIESINLENFYGFLEGVNTGSPNPIIAIVSHYDTFSISPDLPSGLNTNGSGVIALMELVRILSKFYENYDNVLKFDILFILTSAGSLNFEGTQHLLNNLDSGVLDNIQFVLCLDSISDSKDNDLNLHISRFPKENVEENASRLYKIFNATSENMNFNLNFMKKKIYLSAKVVPWEHEQFSKKKILSATLSGMKTPVTNIFNRTNINDNQINKPILKRNIKFLAESLLAFLFDYDIKNFTIFKEDENLLDEANLDSLINYLKKVSRFALNIQKNSHFNNDIFSFMNSYLQKAQRQSFEYKTLKFFDSNSGSIRIYSVKSKIIDLYLLLAILIYLFLVYLYTKGWKNFLTSIKSMFDVEADE